MTRITKKVGRPRKTTNGTVSLSKTTAVEFNILKDVNTVLNGLLTQVAKKAINTEEADAMLRILIHLKVQSKLSPNTFKQERY